MSDILKSVGYLIRCDEVAMRMSGQLKDWTEGINQVFMDIAEGLPRLQHDIDEGRRTLGEVHSQLSSDLSEESEDSAPTCITNSFLELIESHRKDQGILSEFTSQFDVILDVRSALGSMADLMEDVEVFAANALVQAQEAGDKGRKLSRVTHEVMSLTKRAATEFERVRSLAMHIDQNLEDLRNDVVVVQSKFDHLPIRGEKEILGMFSGVDQERDAVLGQVDTLMAGVVESANEISRMILGLQFDDRCSQISHHLAESLGHLHHQIADLTNNDQNLIFADEDTEVMMDTICFGLGVFEVVARLVDTLEEELNMARDDMTNFLEGLCLDLAKKNDNNVSVDALTEVTRKTRRNLEEFMRAVSDLVDAKENIVSRVEILANQMFDLRDDLRGVRRTAKRFGVLGGMVREELKAVGLEKLAESISEEQLEQLNEEMAETVGTVLKALDSTVRKVQRRCGQFHEELAVEEELLSEAQHHTERLVKDLEEMVVPLINRGGSSFRETLTKLFREATTLRLEIGNLSSLSRQSGRIKNDARNRVVRLTEIKMEVLELIGLANWDIRATRVKELYETCTTRAQREVVNGALGHGDLDNDSAAGELTLF